MIRCVNSPSPDHFETSTSIAGCGCGTDSGRLDRSTFECLMDRHETAKNRVVDDAREPAGLHQPRNAFATRIRAQRCRNVTIGVRVAVEGPAEGAAHDSQIHEIQCAYETVQWSIEIERHHAAAHLEDSTQLVERDAEVCNIAKTVADGGDVEGPVLKRQGEHVADQKLHREPGSLCSGQLNHPRRDIERDDIGAAGGKVQSDIPGSGGQIDDTQAWTWFDEIDETLLPFPIAAVRKQHGDEIVTICDRGKQPPHVPPLTFGGRYLFAKVTQGASVA